MVEVFKTNVCHPAQAELIVHQIHQNFLGYRANFDLEDHDKILRVACDLESVQSSYLIHLLKEFGFHAEILPDDVF